ncbi:hypothetical protein EST38_g14405, partial [Candolleomyces aberdarensis]
MKAASSSSALDKDATFGQRLAPKPTPQAPNGKGKARQDYGDDGDDDNDAMEISWVPSTSAADDDDDSARRNKKSKKQDKKNGIERFGAGLEKGALEPEHHISE